MQSDHFERTLRDALRETLDREQGPHPAWTDSPAARRVAERARERRRLGLRVLAVAAAIGVVGGAAVFGGTRVPRPPLPARAAPSSCGNLPGVAGTIIDCSRDGTRLLVQAPGGDLFVRDVDGTETQLTRDLPESDLPWFRNQMGATLSPEGSRVIFAGLTEVGGFCHNGALFAVGVDGRAPQLIWKSHIPQNGIVRDPTFSPDGTQIAFTDGYCDWGHTVWIMNADGTNVHEIISIEDLVGGGHMRGLAWSPAGDRLAVTFIPLDPASTVYSFAPDGSDFKPSGRIGYCWRGLRC